MQALRIIALVFWVGGLWAIGVLVAPILFKSLPTNHALAGTLAGYMFTAMAWVGIVCGLFLLIELTWQIGVRIFQDTGFWLMLGMLVLTLFNHFAIFPLIADLRSGTSSAAVGLFGGGFATWHTISSLIYLLQSILGGFLVYNEFSQKH